jgi:putative flippase GtrA
MTAVPGALRQLVRFLMGSALGLTVDLLVFATAIHLGAPPWLANLASAGSAVVVVYLFVTKYAFGSARSRSTFLLFVGWYVFSIAVFSALIDLLHVQTGWAPFVCKLVSLPPSFAANFVFSKLLFGRRSVAAAPSAGRPGPVRSATGA